MHRIRRCALVLVAVLSLGLLGATCDAAGQEGPTPAPPATETTTDDATETPEDDADTGSSRRGDRGDDY